MFTSRRLAYPAGINLFAIFLMAFHVASYANNDDLLKGQILHVACNGNVIDQSDMKHPVENEGVTFVGDDRLQRQNLACFFDGLDYLKIANNPAFELSNFTIAAWVSTYQIGDEDTRAIVSNYAGGGEAQHYGIHVREGVAGVFYDDGIKLDGARDTDGISLTDEQWHHVAAVFEGGVNTKLYVDGEARRQTSGVMPASISPTGDLYIGRGGSDEGMEDRWRGNLDEIRILNRALSENEINLLSTIIDLPTGETFISTDPTGEKEDAPFFFQVKKGEEGAGESFQVTPNTDGSFSVNHASTGTSRARDGASETTTLVIKDGEMTLIDETLPGVVATVNIFGDLEITDTATPDLKLLLQRNSEQFVFQSLSNPSVFVKVNADGSLTIIDESQPDIIATRDGEPGNITVFDQETNTTAVIDGNGNAILTHPDFPNIEAQFNVYDTEESYTITDTITNECLEVPIDSKARRQVRGFFGSIGQTFSRGVSKISCFLRCHCCSTGGAVGNVIGTVGRVVTSARKFGGFASTVIGGISQYSGLVSGVLGIGSTIVNAIFGNKQKKITKQLEGQVKGLQGQVHTLQATVQQQSQTIQHLEKTVAGQAQTIQRLETTITKLETIIKQQAAIIKQQAEAIAALKETVKQQKQVIDKQAEYIASLEKRIAGLERRTRKGKKGAKDIPPDGKPVGTKSGVRDSASKNECRRLLTPATCQVYGVQDQGLNDSIAFVYNPVEQTTKPIGEPCQGCDLEAMAIHPVTNEIYLGSGDYAIGHPNGHLYKLDASTGQLRSVGVTGFADISGLTFDESGTLWGWAKGQGLVILDTDTGKGHLELSSSMELADLSWDNNYQLLYGVVGKELWSYDPTSGNANQLCDNLSHKTEAVKAASSGGLVWIGSHNNQKMELQAYEVVTCQPQKDLNLFIGYDDVEGLAMPAAACQ